MADWKGNYCWQALQDSKKDGKSGKIMDVATFKIEGTILLVWTKAQDTL